MTALQRAVLELDADVDPNTSGDDTGIFEMVGNLEITESTTVNHTLASGQGAALNAVLADNINRLGDVLGDSVDIDNRAGFYLDLGDGEHNFSINFNGWEGATDSGGNAVQWGNTGDPSEVTHGDATGADPLTQMHVLQQYLLKGTYDSRRASARLKVGEYSPNGMYDDYLHVTITEARMVRVADDPVAFDGSIKLSQVKKWNDLYDAIARVEW